MNFSLYIAKRYLRSKSSQNAVNVINFITFLVIVIGSAALFIVLSGFAGLKEFSLSFSNTFDPDLKAFPATGKFFSISPAQEKDLKAVSGVASYSKELEEKVYLSHREKSHIAYIKGVDSNYNSVTGVDSTIIYGDWTINEMQGVAGIDISNILGVTTNEFRRPLQILAPKPGKGSFSPQQPSNLYNETALVLSGVYAVEESLDKKYVFAALPLVQGLLEKDNNQISGINFKLNPSEDPSQIRDKIQNIFGDKIILRNRQEQNGSLHRMLNTENVAAYLVFTLVLIIAVFNLVGALFMMILDKRKNLKTLYDSGATIKDLRRVFLLQGVLLTVIGGFIGVLIGSLLIGSQLAFGWLKITPSLAYPVAFQLINVLIVFATILVLGMTASKIASSIINKKLISP